ncbi:uncharacterized protein LOC130749736 [Lotus japonicus]|uniref:uncharacterized protein LOC130749736 n=1 Tax=Lotus japonicus TaxID=34305 RepID=UPI00258CDFFD|nr:uncharacterized protein LOC130749736 [Lotus japonicus]
MIGSDTTMCFSNVSNFANSRRVSSLSESSRRVDIDFSEIEAEKNCRICHLGLESDSQEFEAFITLGCSCKDDLSIAHKSCAETWFHIKGDRTCEICHSIAQNVHGTEEIPQPSSPTEASSHARSEEAQRFCHDRHVFFCLLAFLIFIFVISVFFNFIWPSS